MQRCGALQFLRIILLLLPEIQSRASLLAAERQKRTPALNPDFSEYMSLKRFNRLCADMNFINIDADPALSSDAQDMFITTQGGKKCMYHRWDAIDPPILASNNQRKKSFTPGGKLTVDQCMSKWRGKYARYGDSMRQVLKMIRKPEPFL